MRLFGTLLPTCLFLLFITSSLKAQEQVGLRTDNYSGVNSLMLNPANFLSSSFEWDLNVAGAGFFGETNTGYIQNTRLLDIFRMYPDIEVEGAFDYDDESQIPDNVLVTDYYKTYKKTYFMGLTTILGPSFSMKLKSDQTFGIFTSFRAASSSHKIPASLNFYYWDQTSYYQEIDVSPVKGAAMAWSEIGLNYGKRFETYNGFIDLGASIKLLQGYEGFFFENKSRVNITQIPNDTVSMDGPNMIFGFTTTNDSREIDINIKQNGMGMAADLGLVYTVEGEYKDTYLWRFGFSVLDIGKIHFNRNAEFHQVKTDEKVQLNKRDYLELNSIDESANLFSYQAFGDSTASFQSNRFGIWLPGAISLQADYAVTENVFINGLLIQRLGYKKAAVQRGNFIAVTPRFEHRWYGVSLPISVYNYEEFNVGAAFRIGFITIGTENLGSYFKRSDFTGSDFYFAIKVNPFNLNMGSNNRGKGSKCYYF